MFKSKEITFNKKGSHGALPPIRARLYVVNHFLFIPFYCRFYPSKLVSVIDTCLLGIYYNIFLIKINYFNLFFLFSNSLAYDISGFNPFKTKSIIK